MKRWTASVKEHKRRPFQDASFYVHAASQSKARDVYAAMHHVPTRWVRCRRA